MKVLIAPDKFKGSLSAFTVADSIEEGILKVFPDAVVVKVPMADGGEGTVATLVNVMGGEIIKVRVKDPLLRDIESFYGILRDRNTAVIEMAAASGLYLLKEHEKNPMITTTYGTGQLIKDALDRGCRKFIIAIGGSATNDGGAGMAMALGVRFYNKDGKEVGFGGGELSKIYRIDVSNIDKRIKDCEFLVACDVSNPLVGENGASKVYGPQKGATKEMVEILDKNLEHFGRLLEKHFNKRIIDVPGAGAAGGLGAGLIAFLNARLKSGIEIIMDIVDLEQKVRNSDLVITGEGKVDFQTIFGKTVSGIAKLCKKYNKPCIAITGSIDEERQLYKIGITAVFSIIDKPMGLEEAMRDAEVLLKKSTERIFRVIKVLKDFD
ncbi:glycerate kinase [Caldanaerobacter subterraneus]|uniref:Glycerate kinase n=2 Tax=Caldanaerobacter subterraneus TaxID=911092 RepID=A0A4R2J9Y3_9THEO|nr:glycerate kinase [Caldanaerobacter subterraneus]KKC30555.1 glycerate kinase [Caldanaerobacter subterraneus subsp. pacificus DSM 12653]TCO56183.1 glycerate kinase [Caldanaerobacter subterraneus]